MSVAHTFKTWQLRMRKKVRLPGRSSVGLWEASSIRSVDALHGRPRSGTFGQVQFTLAAADSQGNQVTASFSIDVVAEQPSIFPLSIQSPRNSAQAGSEYRSRIQASDAIGRPVTWNLVQGPSGLVVSSEEACSGRQARLILELRLFNC